MTERSDGELPLRVGGSRWPEVLVGALALAAIGGTGWLLLGERAPEPEVVAATPVGPAVIPASPGVTVVPKSPVPAPAAKSTQGAASAGQIPPAPPAPPVAKIPPPVLPEPKQIAGPPPPAAREEVAEPSPAPAVQASAEPAPPAANPVAPQQESEVPAEPPQAPAPPSVSPRAGGAVAASEQRTPLRTDYRVMLGTFGNRATLQSATAQVAALGYTVYAIDVGNQYVAQVGPFADESVARQAVEDMRRVYPRAEVYAPRGRPQPAPEPAAQEAPAKAAPSQSATPPKASAPELTAPEPEPLPQEAPSPAPTPPAPSGLTSLQVGAFNNPEGAQQFVEQLRAQGFRPTLSAQAGKTTVVLGPLSGEALLATEQQLRAAGLDYFRLR